MSALSPIPTGKSVGRAVGLSTRVPFPLNFQCGLIGSALLNRQEFWTTLAACSTPSVAETPCIPDIPATRFSGAWEGVVQIVSAHRTEIHVCTACRDNADEAARDAVLDAILLACPHRQLPATRREIER